MNGPILSHLKRLHLAGGLKSNAVAIAVFEVQSANPHTEESQGRSWRALQPYAGWHHLVKYDDRSQCERFGRHFVKYTAPIRDRSNSFWSRVRLAKYPQDTPPQDYDADDLWFFKHHGDDANYVLHNRFGCARARGALLAAAFDIGKLPTTFATSPPPPPKAKDNLESVYNASTQ